jgi:DNA-binding MarR family transcriptional regulator
MASRESIGPATNSLHELAKGYKERYPEADQDAVEITVRLFASEVVGHAAQARFFRMVGVERSMARYTILRILYFADGRLISQKEIGDQTRATSANVTYLIDGLEREGLVERVQDPQDRRFSYVRLTAEGGELAAFLIPKMVEFMNHLVRGFSEEEKRTFNDLLARIQANAETSYVE